MPLLASTTKFEDDSLGALIGQIPDDEEDDDTEDADEEDGEEEE